MAEKQKPIVDDAVLDRISEIARLKLTEAEREAFKKDCNEILGYFSQISTLSKGGGQERFYMRQEPAKFRSDEVEPSDASSGIRSQFAHATKDGLMKAPKNL